MAHNALLIEMADPALKNRLPSFVLPSFVLSCRDLGQFWGYAEGRATVAVGAGMLDESSRASASTAMAAACARGRSLLAFVLPAVIVLLVVR